ncbi:RsiV family protein [Pasteurella skyensis]|uniref:RsiV family protein n=1 Tax=Phocoenobacter skyensis TaxID=97481 RepID=UPI002791F546|nr:RsiV family protein [Pasteurella skyensis]MDP8170660.1 RsiV family protein [Pasteurella skyensis]
MKKRILSIVIISTLFLVGCNEEKLEQLKQKQLEQKAQFEQKIQQLESQIDLLEKEKAIKIQNEVMLFQRKDDTYPVEFSFATLNTNKAWLNDLLITQMLMSNLNNKKRDNTLDSKTQLLQILTEKYEHELNEAKDTFKDLPKEQISGTYFSADYYSSIDYVGQRENLATFVQNNFNYIGGAHGIHNVKYLNIDLNKKIILSLDDLFTTENQTKLKEMLWDRYEPQYRTADGNMGFFFQNKQKLYLPKDFYFSALGINFVYPVYEIGSYADGQKELTLSWSEINPLINQAFSTRKALFSE